jgi:hypothetical protein
LGSIEIESEIAMSRNAKKSMGWMVVLILLGLTALFAGAKWLVVLVPAAMLIWYGASPAVRSGRN